MSLRTLVTAAGAHLRERAAALTCSAMLPVSVAIAGITCALSVCVRT